MYWEVINISNIEKAYFSIDRENEYYEGYHNPKKLWNGWAMPCFEKRMTDIYTLTLMVEQTSLSLLD